MIRILSDLMSIIIMQNMQNVQNLQNLQNLQNMQKYVTSQQSSGFWVRMMIIIKNDNGDCDNKQMMDGSVHDDNEDQIEHALL